jgi:hypothetical protein
MKQYYKIINGETVFFTNPLVVGDMQIINPSEEILLAAGWLEYIPPEPEPVDTTKYEPYTDEVVAKVKQLMQQQVAQQTDEEALGNIELFPTWQSKIGVQVNQGDRLYFDDKLFKVLQTHTPQKDWRPDTTASLYVQVVLEGEQGTIDNPIPYSVNMELVLGNYYIENGITYLCTQALAASYWSLSDLVGTYVEVVE